MALKYENEDIWGPFNLSRIKDTTWYTKEVKDASSAIVALLCICNVLTPWIIWSMFIDIGQSLKVLLMSCTLSFFFQTGNAS